MSDEEFEEQQQLDLQGQADPKIILIRIGGQNVTTQVDQSELESVDKMDRKKTKEKLIPVRESATEQASEEQPVTEDSANLHQKSEEPRQDKLQQKSNNVQIFAKNVQSSVKKEKSTPKTVQSNAKTVQSSSKTVYGRPLKDSSNQRNVNYEIRPSLQIGIIGTVELAIEVDLRAYRSQLYSLLQIYKKLNKHPETDHLVKLIMALDNHQRLNNAQLMKMHSEFGDMVTPEDILGAQRENLANQENAR